MTTIADRLLAHIWDLEQAGHPTNKAAITEGMADRTAARRWRTIETLWARGWLYRVWPTVGPSYFRLTEDGRHHLSQLQKEKA